jgi:Na+-transporting NADH:ubiquinone oxidoreductase subunit NqrB
LSLANPTAPHATSRRQYYLNPWWSDRRVYFTRLSVDECRQVINQATTRFMAAQVHRSFFSTADFTLYRASFFRNGMRPFAYIRLREVLGQGTLVTVTLSTSRFARVFFGVWFGFLAVWAVLATLLTTGGQKADFTAVPFAVGMALFGWLFTLVGRVMASRDPAFLLRFLTEELSLTEPPPGTSSLT